MSRAAIGALALSLLCGCAQSSSSPSATPETTATQPAPGTFPVPKWDMSDRLGLLADDNSLVQVGDSAEIFRSHFPRSASLARSLGGDDIPMDILQDTHWSVAGYEYENASRGAGAILYDNRVAVAMRQLESVQEQEVQQEVAKYKAQFSTPRTVFSSRVRYWFWEVPPVRLMVCAFKTDQGTYNLTTAIGDDDVATKLGISPDVAETNKDTVEHLFGATGASSAGATNPQ